MRYIKYIIFTLLFSGGLIFYFSPLLTPDSFLSPAILEKAEQADVVIVFNSGGWGNTPLEEAKDFAPVITGIQETLDRLGYNSIVIPFERTKDNLLSKITHAKEVLNSFSFTSEVLAKEIEMLAKALPDKKIIVTGLSNGAAFTTKTYEKISKDFQDSVYAISAGLPFWVESVDSDNILQLTNQGQDALAAGNAKHLLLGLVKAPLEFFNPSKLNQMAKGHNYPWDFSGAEPRIVSFLEDRLQ